MTSLRRLKLKGFKSIKEMDLEFRPLNVLIGANGAGKSNLVSFFQMLSEIALGRTQHYISKAGRAHSFLHFGPKKTGELEAELKFGSDGNFGSEDEVLSYKIRLAYAVGDTLIFSEETVSRKEFLVTDSLGLGSGHLEARIMEAPDQVNESSLGIIRRFLKGSKVYHFQDTSQASRVRQFCYVGDNRLLAPDAGNLAPFLIRLREIEGGKIYRRIINTIRLIAPFFDDFELGLPGNGSSQDVILDWRERESDQVFGPHQLSDGTLRAICLITLLMQPEKELPELLIVDDPELGLHPYAIGVIAALFKKASHHTQVLISTQSSAFLDHFEPKDVIVVNRIGMESQFLRPDVENLNEWLEEYSLGEVWEKNVLGGGPH